MHEYINITNTLRELTQGEICLDPTVNLQRTYKFLSLSTGNKITRGKFTEVPTPTIVLKQVAAMALAEKNQRG